MRIIPSIIKSTFFNIISDAETHVDELVLNPGKDMTRHRSCTFSDTILAIMNFSMNRLNTELFFFFADQLKNVLSKSAFCKQRKKFNNKLFPYLMKSFYDAFPSPSNYKGYTLALVYLHSVNRDYIIQEIYAKMILYNFASLLHRYAEKVRKTPKEKNKYHHKVSFNDAVPIARMFLKRNISNKRISYQNLLSNNI